MANSRSFRIEGMEDVLKSLQGLERTVQIEASKAAVSAGGKIIVEDAKSRAPVRSDGAPRRNRKGGKFRRAGRLKKSIVFKFGGAGGGLGSIPDILGLETRVYGVIAVKDPLGHLIEYGHRTVKGQKRSSKSRHEAKGKEFVSPQPFLRPAIDENQEKVLNAMANAVKEVLKLK